MTNLLSGIVKFISHRFIGIGLGLALIPASAVAAGFVSFFGVSFGNYTLRSIVALGLVSFALGFAGFQMYKKISKVEFFPVLDFCSIIFLTFFWMIRGPATDPTARTVADVFVVSGFFVIGVIALQGRSKLLRICSGILFGIVSFFVFPNILITSDLFVPLLVVASVLLAAGVIATIKNQKFLKNFSGIFFSVSLFFTSYTITGDNYHFWLVAPPAIFFTSMGITGIYENKNYRKIGRFFRVLSLLCLVCVLIPYTLYFNWSVNTLEQFFDLLIILPVMLPLVLTSFAFFVLSRLMTLYEHPQKVKNQDLNNMTAAEQTNPNINYRKLGLSVMVLSQFIFIIAALFSVLQVPIGRFFEFFTEYATAFPFTIGVALFALGPALMLYKKPNRLELLAVVLGSVLLITAAFCQFYPHYVPVQRGPPSYITPYSDYALPIFLASILLFAMGYVIITARKIFEKTKE